MSLTRFALRNRAVTWLLFAAVMTFGIISVFLLSRREDPNVSERWGQVIALYPGATGAQVEQLVADPLERTILELDDVKSVTSTTRPGITVLDVEVGDRTRDIPKFWRDLRDRVGDSEPDLPAGVQMTINDRFVDTSALVFGVTWPGASDRQREDAGKLLRDRLRQIPDVAEATVLGAQDERIYVDLSPIRMARMGVTPTQVQQAIASRNVLALTGGSALSGAARFAIAPTGDIGGTADLGSVVVAAAPALPGQGGGSPVYLRDIARITRGYADPSSFLIRVNGQSAVAVSVTMRKGRNLSTLGAEIRQALPAIRVAMPVGATITIVNDLPRSVQRRMGDFVENLVSGVALIFVVMGLFLGLRSALIVGTLVPVTIVGTFLAMWLFGRDIQQISISALIISLGLVVDNSIVVIDNIEKKLAEGMEREHAVIAGTDELRRPLLTSNLTTIASFAPLVLLSGGTGEFIQDLGIVTSMATVVSLVFNLTIAPLLALAFLRAHAAERTGPVTRLVDAAVGALRRAMHALAVRGLRRPRRTVALATIGFAIAVTLIPHLGTQFFPSAERDQFTIDVWLPEGRDISATAAVTARVERILAGCPTVVSAVSYIGQGGPRFYYNISPEPPAPNYAQIVVNTRSVDDTAALVARVQRAADATIPDARITVRHLEQGPPVGAPIAVRISGPDVGQLRALAASVESILTSTPGTGTVYSNYGELPLALKVDVDEDRAARLGVTSADVALATQMGFSGVTATIVREGDRQIPVMLRADAADRAGPGLVGDMAVPTRFGTAVPVRQVARLSLGPAEGRVVRRNHVRTLTVFGFTDGSRLPSQVLADAQRRIGAFPLPDGYRLSYGGEDEQIQQTFTEMMLVLGLIVVTNLIIVVWEFNSMRVGLAILAAMPFSLTGAIVGLFLTHQNFGFMAFLGITSLAGVVTNHAIVFFEYALADHRRGTPMTAALIAAGQSRLRPILLTVLLSIFGVLPQAVNGGSLWPPMAWSLIFGLAASLVLTLVVIPSVYALMEGSEGR
jgi:multidrug efflux pump subunit AcrB